MRVRHSSPVRLEFSTTKLRGSGIVLLALLAVACGGEDATSGEPMAMTSVGDGPDMDDPDVDDPGIDDNGELLVDDLEDGDEKFTLRGLDGEWFTYADDTADVSPPSHMGVGDTPGEVHVSGSNFSEWGVAVAAYFQYSDLSDFKGVKVRIKGTGRVRFELSTADTLPLDHNGTCETGCYGHYATNVDLTTEYEDVTVLFEDLVQPSWAAQVPLSLERAGQVDFLMPGTASAPATIDLWIDRLSLIAADP